MKTMLIFMAALLYTEHAMAGTQIYFSPSPDCENQIIKRIEATTKTLDIAVYGLTSAPLAEAIVRANNRGVKVRVLTDRIQSSNQVAKTRWLVDQGVDIRIHSKYKLMHNKIAVFDGREFVTGSYNWTQNAKKGNAENCLFVSDEAESLNKLQTEFEHLWQINTAQKHQIWLEKANK